MADASAKRPLLSSLSDPQRQQQQQQQRKRFRRWKTAPSRDTLSMSMDKDSALNPESNPVFKNLLPSFRLVALLLVLYLAIGSTCFYLVRHQLVGKKTNGVLDSLYLCIVTMTTVGYGDLVPDSIGSKLLACVFVFSGMAIVALFLSNAADYLLEKQELLLIKALEQRHRTHNNADKKQMLLKEMEPNKVKYKLFMSTGALAILVIVATLILSLVEKLGIIDAFYCVCSTVTTLGYGDKSFSTTGGRAFAVVWILISTICLAQCFVHLAELRAEQRQQSLVKWVLARRLTFGDLEAADLDDDDVVSGAEFVIYKLTEMGKIKREDVELVMEEFERADADQSGTISESDLIHIM